MSRGLWATIVDKQTAQQARKDGELGALLCAGFFAALAIDAWWFYHGKGAVVAAMFAVIYAGLYAFTKWRIGRRSTAPVDAAALVLPLALAGVWHDPALQSGGYWYGLVPLLVTIIGFWLVNGVRGASYLA